MTLLDAAASGRIRLVAPEFGLLEFANVLWKAEHRGYLPAPRVEEVLEDLPGWRIQWAPAQPLLRRSVFFARATGQGGYDGVFLALAERIGASFVTADGRLLAAWTGRLGSVVALWGVMARIGARPVV